MGDSEGALTIVPTLTLTLTFVGKDIIARLREFMENETKSCSMDFGCITPEYVYRMWGGSVHLGDIEAAMVELRRQPENA